MVLKVFVHVRGYNGTAGLVLDVGLNNGSTLTTGVSVLLWFAKPINEEA